MPRPPTAGAIRLSLILDNSGAFVTKLYDDLSLFVPLVLSFSGANNTFFTSELTLTNRAARDVTLNFVYTAIVADGSGTASDTLPAGRQRIFPDAIAYLKSLGIPIPASGDRGGSLVVRFSGHDSSSEGAVLVRTTHPYRWACWARLRRDSHFSHFERSRLYLRVASKRDRPHQSGHPQYGYAVGGHHYTALDRLSGNPTAPSSVTLPDVILFPRGSTRSTTFSSRTDCRSTAATSASSG